MMNPREQECIGYYLYGAGYFARDQNTLGLATGQRTSPHFCLTCPRREECENRHERRVREIAPKASENFDRRMKEAIQRGIPVTLAAAFLAKQSLDPFALQAVENFKRGHGDRRARPLVS